MEKVLIIVRNDVLRVYLELKTSRKYEVKAVKSPSEGLEWLDRNQVSLILTDYQKGITEEDFLLRQIETVAFWSGASLLVVKDDKDITLPKKNRLIQSVTKSLLSIKLCPKIRSLVNSASLKNSEIN
tara:strand:- start:131 stop:511 length:381 start_codon:yes stop_codon:yes gene_type:complete